MYVWPQNEEWTTSYMTMYVASNIFLILATIIGERSGGLGLEKVLDASTFFGDIL